MPRIHKRTTIQASFQRGLQRLRWTRHAEQHGRKAAKRLHEFQALHDTLVSRAKLKSPKPLRLGLALERLDKIADKAARHAEQAAHFANLAEGNTVLIRMHG